MKESFQFLCIVLTITGLVCVCSTAAYAQSRQEHIHNMSHSVMPFDVSKTMHIFKMTEFGGVQRVVSKNPGDSDQIALIRQHLQHEADMFQAGNYSDPIKLHGADMPGLKELKDGASRIKVTYATLPLGAEIIFESRFVSIFFFKRLA